MSTAGGLRHCGQGVGVATGSSRAGYPRCGGEESSYTALRVANGPTLLEAKKPKCYIAVLLTEPPFIYLFIFGVCLCVLGLQTLTEETN